MVVRKRQYLLGLAALTVLFVVGAPEAATAAVSCETGTTCTSTSTDTVTVEQPVPGTTEDVETFQTRVVLRTPTGTTSEQSAAAASDSAEVDDLIADAKASAEAAGLQVTATEATSPVRTLANSTQTEVTTLDREETSVQVELTIGPGTAQIGPDRSETYVVPNGTSLINTNTRTTRFVNVATNTTNTYLTTATVTIVAVAPTTTTTTTTPTTSPTTTAPAAVSPGSTDAPTGELARTGSSNGPWTAAGVTLVLAGAGCLNLSRRTARRPSP